MSGAAPRVPVAAAQPAASAGASSPGAAMNGSMKPAA